MTARTLELPSSLSPAASPSGLAAVVSAFAAFVKGVLAQPAPEAVVSETEYRSNGYGDWRDLSAELVNAQYGYVGNLHGAVRSYVEATTR